MQAKTTIAALAALIFCGPTASQVLNGSASQKERNGAWETLFLRIEGQGYGRATTRAADGNILAIDFPASLGCATPTMQILIPMQGTIDQPSKTPVTGFLRVDSHQPEAFSEKIEVTAGDAAGVVSFSDTDSIRRLVIGMVGGSALRMQVNNVAEPFGIKFPIWGADAAMRRAMSLCEKQ